MQSFWLHEPIYLYPKARAASPALNGIKSFLRYRKVYDFERFL